MNILVARHAAVPLLERQDDLPYPAGVVEFADDEGEEPDDEAGAIGARALRRAGRAGDRPRAGARGARGAGLLPDGGHRRVRAGRPSRSCSSCARRTPACDCWRRCCRPRSSASSCSSARRRARTRTARSASASALLRQVAELLGGLQHEQRELVQHRRLAGRVVGEADGPVFVAHVVAQHRSRARRQGELGGRGPCRSSWIARAFTICSSLSLGSRGRCRSPRLLRSRAA